MAISRNQSRSLLRSVFNSVVMRIKFEQKYPPIQAAKACFDKAGDPVYKVERPNYWESGIFLFMALRFDHKLFTTECEHQKLSKVMSLLASTTRLPLKQTKNRPAN
jgi:hypothetical protein